MGLGTDGFAGSNNDASLFEEMDLAAKIQKITRLDPTVLPAQTALEMATITGAGALGMEKEIGSLEPGKRADMITVNLDQPRGVPVYDVYSEIVYALKAARCFGCDGERGADCSRPANADAQRSGDHGQSGGISPQGFRIHR